jgi:NADH-quinone oxidoreductase subunit N
MLQVFQLSDILATGPLTIVTITALLVLVVESIADRSEHVTLWLAIGGLAAAFVTAWTWIDTRGTAYDGMVLTGGYASYAAMVFTAAGVLTLMLSPAYVRRQGIDHGEYTALTLLALTGMILMGSAADLVIFFLGLEIMSVCFYVLAGFLRGRTTSNEAALKYFLLGAFATGFLLYGIALVYGATGSTALTVILTRSPALAGSFLFLAGLALLLIGLAFKVAAVPFHMWVPDVYEGAPTTVTGFMSTAGKAAAFSAFLLIFAPALTSAHPAVRDVLAAVAALSMVVGNVLAIAQSSVKRMLAYSSIAHAGYMLTGIVAANPEGAQGVLYYLAAYALMNIGAFGILSILESDDGGSVGYDDYAGLSGTKPVLAAGMALFMFSLAGIPPFAGFFGKYYVFAGAVKAGYTWLAVTGVLMSVVSAYYYLRLVVLMYFKEQPCRLEPQSSWLGLAAVAIAAAAVVQIGLLPSTLLGLMKGFF